MIIRIKVRQKHQQQQLQKKIVFYFFLINIIITYPLISFIIGSSIFFIIHADCNACKCPPYHSSHSVSCFVHRNVLDSTAPNSARVTFLSHLNSLVVPHFPSLHIKPREHASSIYFCVSSSALA